MEKTKDNDLLPFLINLIIPNDTYHLLLMINFKLRNKCPTINDITLVSLGMMTIMFTSNNAKRNNSCHISF